MPVTSTWPSPPNPSLQCTYHYRAKAVRTSVDWQVCLHTENVLWRRNVWDLGGISLKSKSTTNIFTTVLFGLNRVWSQIKQELISHHHSPQETEKTAALKCHVISLEVLFLSKQSNRRALQPKFSIISKLQNTFSVRITVLWQHDNLIKSPSILVLCSWKYKISFWISGPWISLFIISFLQSSYQSFNRKTQLHSQLIVDV